MRRYGTLILVALALLFPVSACGSGAGGGAGASTAHQEIVMASWYDSAYASLDPVRNGGLGPDATIMAAIYGFLVYLDEAGTVRYDLAESLKPQGDASTWILTLKPRLKFSDGQPLDAHAVAWNFNRLADPKSASYHYQNMAGLSAEPVDDRTVKVTLPKPNGSFDRMIASTAGMIASPTAYQADSDGFARRPVGAGPYVLDDWVAGSTIKLKKSPTYYRAGEVTVERVTVQVIPDPAQGLNAVKSGQAHIRPYAPLRSVKEAEQAGLGTTQLLVSGFSGITFNTRKPPFDDIRARQAVAYALDPQALAEVTGGPTAEISQSLFPAASVFFEPALPPMNDRARAQRLFDELAAEGKRVKFRILALTSGASSVEALQSQLSAFDNVEVKLDVRESQAYTAALTTQLDFDIAARLLAFGDPEPRIYDLLATGGNQNKAGYSNPEADRLLSQARALPGDERVALLKQVQQLVAKDALFLPFEQPAVRFIHAKGLKLPMVNDGVILFDRIIGE